MSRHSWICLIVYIQILTGSAAGKNSRCQSTGGSVIAYIQIQTGSAAGKNSRCQGTAGSVWLFTTRFRQEMQQLRTPDFKAQTNEIGQVTSLSSSPFSSLLSFVTVDWVSSLLDQIENQGPVKCVLLVFGTDFHQTSYLCNLFVSCWLVYLVWQTFTCVCLGWPRFPTKWK